MDGKPWTSGNRWVGIDLQRRRIWVGGQRLHHGLTGCILAGAGVAGLAAKRITPRGGVPWALVGAALMAHDWKDRGVWFARGTQLESRR